MYKFTVLLVGLFVIGMGWLLQTSIPDRIVLVFGFMGIAIIQLCILVYLEERASLPKAATSSQEDTAAKTN